MATSLRVGGAAALAVALGITLAGCGSDSSSDQGSATEETSTSASETPAAAATPSPEPNAPAYTIVDYISDNDIQEESIKAGTPGAPTVELPLPPGWQDSGPGAPEWALSAMEFGDPAMAADPPTIIALMSKLSGDVDPAKILEYAPNEIKNLPGYEDLGGTESDLSGFQAFQVGGAYTRDGAKRLIAQKTVVIPSGPDLYVLQINADGLEDQIGPLMDATAAIDEQAKITA